MANIVFELLTGWIEEGVLFYWCWWKIERSICWLGSQMGRHFIVW